MPSTNFNKKRDKLFFFTGYQYFAQVLDTGLIRATVPTAGQRQGNFSAEELAKEGPFTASGSAPQPLKAATLAQYPDGIFPKSVIDPSMQAMMNLYPLPNAIPTQQSPYNWQDDLHFNQNISRHVRLNPLDHQYLFGVIGLAEFHFNNFSIGGLHGAADKPRLDGQFAMAAVDEHQELDA